MVLTFLQTTAQQLIQILHVFWVGEPLLTPTQKQVMPYTTAWNSSHLAVSVKQIKTANFDWSPQQR